MRAFILDLTDFQRFLVCLEVCAVVVDASVAVGFYLVALQ
jgi:hypothetical protein